MSADRALDTEAIVRLLAKRGVDFVVIGGIAAVIHGSPRNTWDFDLSVATDRANLDALGEALTEIEARLYGLDGDAPFVTDADSLRRLEILTLATNLGKIDVLTNPQGAPPYEVLRSRATPYDIDGVRVLVASIPDLLSMKRAAGRPKDLADIAELETIQRLSRQA